MANTFLVAFVDDIVIIDDDHEGVIHLMQHLSSHLRTKDFCKLKYFLGIEVAQCSRGISISNRKYAFDIGRH